jgi:hypothetical protein
MITIWNYSDRIILNSDSPVFLSIYFYIFEFGYFLNDELEIQIIKYNNPVQ